MGCVVGHGDIAGGGEEVHDDEEGRIRDRATVDPLANDREITIASGPRITAPGQPKITMIATVMTKPTDILLLP